MARDWVKDTTIVRSLTGDYRPVCINSLADDGAVRAQKCRYALHQRPAGDDNLAVRLVNDETEESLHGVWAYLTPDEARDLYEALRYRFEEPDDETDWHAHVGTPSGPLLTVAIEVPPSA